MDHRLDRLERKIDALADRVARLEAGAATGRADDRGDDLLAQPPAAIDDAAGARSPWDAGPIAALLGRTSLVLAGAYLLRAFTKAGLLAQPVGVAAGLGYALSWLAAAGHAQTRGRRLSAAFHSQIAVFLTFPLIFEATSTFAVLTPVTSVWLLALVTTTMVVAAASRRLPELAWSSTLAAAATLIGLGLVTRSAVAIGACLVWLAVLATWVSYLRAWRALAWFTAVVADVTVIVIAVRSVQPSSSQSPEHVMWLPLLLFGVFSLTFAARTLARPHAVGVFETVQGLASVIAGLGVAIWLTRQSGVAVQVLGTVTIVLAAATCTLAYFYRRTDTWLLEYYASLGTALILVASLVPGFNRWLSLCWIAAAFAAMYAAKRFDRPTLAIHGSIYALAAAAQSGSLSAATQAVLTSPRVSDGAMTRAGLAVLAALTLIASIPPAETGSRSQWLVRMPKLVVLAAASYLLLGTATGVMVGLLGLAPLVTIRTVCLVGLTLVLSWLARARMFREASALVYPLLVATGLKLVFDDVLHADPAALFIAFSAYGAALIAGPRLARRAT